MSQKTATPSFHSESLRDAVAKARPTLEGYDEERDKVSKDIKALEAYLQTLGLNEEFRYSFGKCIVAEGPDSAFAAAIEYGGCASGTIQENAIAWSLNANGKWRLLFETNKWQGSVDVDIPGGPYFWDESTLVREAKPLIESKLEVRVEAYKRLPDFVAALTRHLQIDPPEELDDLPF